MPLYSNIPLEPGKKGNAQVDTNREQHFGYCATWFSACGQNLSAHKKLFSRRVYSMCIQIGNPVYIPFGVGIFGEYYLDGFDLFPLSPHFGGTPRPSGDSLWGYVIGCHWCHWCHCGAKKVVYFILSTVNASACPSSQRPRVPTMETDCAWLLLIAICNPGSGPLVDRSSDSRSRRDTWHKGLTLA